MLMTDTPQGRYPYAGHSLVFDDLRPRWPDHRAADAVARPQRGARRVAPACGAPGHHDRPAVPTPEPGKILHEMRDGEMAYLREVPFRLYYGSVDSTPLFVLLAGLYSERTADDETLAQLWPNIEAGASPGSTGRPDADGDGFIEYRRASELGLSPTRAGRILTTRSFMPTAGWPKAASRWQKCRAYVFAAKTTDRASRAPAGQGGLRPAPRSRCQPTRRALRSDLLVSRSPHLRAGRSTATSSRAACVPRTPDSCC